MQKKIEPLFKGQGSYIDGSFVKASDDEKMCSILSPADLKDTVFEYFIDPSHVDLACESAFRAFGAWSSLHPKNREKYFLKLAQIYRENEESLAVLISRETGKPLWESRLEVKSLSQKIHITLDHSLPLVETKKIDSMKPKVQTFIRYKPRGVFVVIGPFNFPLHLPNGHLISALASGNTVIFKPSEKTPASGEKLAKMFDLAGFPKGVFNLIQGGSEVSKRLIQHKKVRGVLFTGSYRVGQEIKKQLLEHPQKILALEMGGKNYTVVWSIKNLTRAIHETLKGAYLTAGQRCSATANLILHPKIKEEFLNRLISLTRSLKIGHWRDNSFMGPLIDEKAVSHFLKASEEAEKTGANLHLKGKSMHSLGGHYVSPSLVEPKNYDSSAKYQSEELFAPHLNVYTTDQEEEALYWINDSGYGLCLSIFSEEEKFAEKIFQNANVGVFHWNSSSNGASSFLPFGGLGKSGNDRPAGMFAIYSCTTPVAWMRSKEDDKTPSLSENFFQKD